MNATVATLVTEFEAAARAAQQAEEALRKKMAEEVARMERRRAFAFRRTRLVRVLATAAVSAEQEEFALSAQRLGVRNELGWEGENEIRAAILDRLQQVGRVVWQCACGEDGRTTAALNTELEAFEAWYEETYGKSFYTLFDHYVPELPVVDF